MSRKLFLSSPERNRVRRSSRLALEPLEARDLPAGWPPYLVQIAPGIGIAPLLTVGDVVDRTGVPGQQYRMAGIPDGLGAYATDHGTVQLFMNHEMVEGTNSSVPRVGGVAYPDTQTGAFVSKYI